MEPAGRGRSQQTLGQTLQNTRKKTSCSVASRRCPQKPPLSVRGVGERVRRRQIETLLPGSGRGLLRAPAGQPISRKQRLLHCLHSFGQFFFFLTCVCAQLCCCCAPCSLLTAIGRWHTNQFNTSTDRKADGVFPAGDGEGL